jgi:hypothetical protein
MPYRLVYASRITEDAASRLPSTMQDLLIVSVLRNARDHITGFLLSDGASFTQVLEGDQAEVDACFARIMRDRRHTEVTLKFRGPVQAREFPRWSMCGLYLSPLDDALVDELDDPFDLMAADAGVLIELLRRLSERYGPALDRIHDELLPRAS